MTAGAPDGELNHGLVLPNWEVASDAEQLVEYGVAAEEAGWDGVFLADHLIFPPRFPDQARDEYDDFHDPWITMAAIASRTSAIRLGSWVTPIARRQPWQLARDTATLDRLSNGRVILGTGLGRSSDYTTFGEPWEPKQIAARYDEALEIIDRLWRGESVSYDGAHFTVDEAVIKPTPVQEPRIPVIVGGFWPNKKPFHRGARWDGIIPHYPGDGTVPDEGIDGFLPASEQEPEQEVADMLEYYREVAGGSGAVFMPAPPDRVADWVGLCKDLDVSWLITRPKEHGGDWDISMDRVREGPPE